MPETFLVLLAGGVMLAAAVSDPKQVTLNWLRLAGIIALCFVALGAFFYLTRASPADTPAFFRRVQAGLMIATAASVLAQLATAQVAMRRAQRVLAAAAFVVAVLAGANLLHDSMLAQQARTQIALNLPPKHVALAIQAAAC